MYQFVFVELSLNFVEILCKIKIDRARYLSEFMAKVGKYPTDPRLSNFI